MSKNRFLDGLEGRQKLLVILVGLFIIGINLTYLIGGLPLTVLMLGASFFLLWISRFVWASPNHGQLRISLAILSSAAFVSYALLQTRPWFLCLFPLVNIWESSWKVETEQLQKCFINLTTVDRLAIVLVFAINILAIYLVFKLWRDRTETTTNNNAIDSELSGEDYQNRLQSFLNALEANPGYENDRTFSETVFIDLQAQIQNNQNNNKFRKKVNLIPFIKSEVKNQNILLLGDSGAGKSCTLSAL